MPAEDQPIPEDLHLHCTHCGYDLTGLLERTCPECGESFAPRETWLANEKSTWAWHFQNRYTPWDYIETAIVLVLVGFYALFCWMEPLSLWAFVLIVPGEIFIYSTVTDAKPWRYAYLIASLLWAIFITTSNPF